MEIHGNGEQIRTFTFIEDIIDALLLIIDSEKSNNQVFNIGTHEKEKISILELANKIWLMINGASSKPALKFTPYESFGKYEDVMYRVPDISKIQNMLGYSPKICLDEGLKQTFFWLKGVKNNNQD